MQSTSSPVVSLLPPAHDIPTDHHAPPTSSYVPFVGPSNVPSFQNPWKSYRMATLTDAWTAYQKGAAIAMSRPKTPGPPRSPSTEDLLREAGYDYGGEGEGEEEASGATEPWDPPEKVKSFLRREMYVRPEFSQFVEGDEDGDWRDPPVELVSPKWQDEEEPCVSWLGHAAVLIRIPWKTQPPGIRREGMCGVLFDPIFSYRCSPSQYVGPARHLPPPCKVEELPEIHACCISHDHYDHLDYYTIMDLWKYHRATIHFFVPLGLKAWFIASSIPANRVTELDWWHETVLSFSSTRPSLPTYDSPTAPPLPSTHYPPLESPVPTLDSSADLNLKLAFTPAQHRSGRGVLDHMTTLWGSWCLGVIEPSTSDYARRGMQDWQGFKAFFGGDTGYRYATAPTEDTTAVCPAFSQISSLYSPFALSLLPVATGSSLPFLRNLLSLSLDQYTLTSSLHCSPGDALDMHRVLRSERSLGIHWGTFCDGDETRGTRVDLGRRRRQRGISGEWEAGEDGDEGRFVLCDIGETLVLPRSR